MSDISGDIKFLHKFSAVRPISFFWSTTPHFPPVLQWEGCLSYLNSKVALIQQCKHCLATLWLMFYWPLIWALCHSPWCRTWCELWSASRWQTSAGSSMDRRDIRPSPSTACTWSTESSNMRTYLHTQRNFCVFWKTTPYGEIFKVLFRKFSSLHRSTCCVQISWNLADGNSVK